MWSIQTLMKLLMGVITASWPGVGPTRLVIDPQVQNKTAPQAK